jgi:hypothetical protein
MGNIVFEQKMRTNFLLVLLFCVFLSLFQANGQEKARISVTGVGVVSVLPNQVEINIEASSKEDKAKEALESNNKRLTKIIEVLRELGIPDTSIATSNFQVQPQAEYPDRDKPPKWYYVAKSTLRIRLNRIDNTGEIIDRIVSAGATSVSTPIFISTAEDSLRSVTYSKAVDDARSKAQKLADSFGVKVGKALQISVDMYDIEPKKYYYRPGFDYPMALQAGTIVMPYYVSKQAKVDVTFEILYTEK